MSADKFVFGVGPAEKIQEALRRNVKRVTGHEMEILEWLAMGDNIVKVGEVAHGISIIGPVEYIVDLDVDPMIPFGWGIEYHTKGGQFKFDPTKVELFLSEGQIIDIVRGHNLYKEFKERPVFNANLLDFYLAHPELIPKEWKSKSVFFWGTIYRGNGSDRFVRYLHWGGTGWVWNDSWLNHYWDCNMPAVVFRK